MGRPKKSVGTRICDICNGRHIADTTGCPLQNRDNRRKGQCLACGKTTCNKSVQTCKSCGKTKVREAVTALRDQGIPVGKIACHLEKTKQAVSQMLARIKRSKEHEQSQDQFD